MPSKYGKKKAQQAAQESNRKVWRAQSGKSRLEGGSVKGPPLPPEIFAIIGEHLAGEHQLQSLSNLNLVNKLIHHATKPEEDWEEVSVESMREDRSSKSWTRYKDKIGRIPSACKYVKYLFFSPECNIEQIWIPSIFPSLKAWFRTNNKSSGDFTNICGSLHRPVSSYDLFAHILRTPLRQQFDTTTRACSPTFLRHLALHDHGCIYPDEQASRRRAVSGKLALRLSATILSWEKRNETSDGEGQSTRDITTLFELLKMVEWSAKALTARETLQWERGETFYDAEERWYGNDEEERLMSFSLGCDVDELRMEYLLEHFPRLVEEHPDVLRNRLQFNCTYPATPFKLLEMTTTFQKCYAAHPDRITTARRSTELVQVGPRGDQGTLKGFLSRCWRPKERKEGLLVEIKSEPLRLQAVFEEEEEREIVRRNEEAGLIWFSKVQWLHRGNVAISD
ncbi:hypothetical protein QFC21_004624 [Naganishia friedmannii]|uniref:Uncharacterized protein n=1 Tax=Naganishia friedmannii TaxID=89922 RepID=A0ACC2VF99_9TREE|nr:hypothetical protein QFC21_004624 [Naganishia friedmannii]